MSALKRSMGGGNALLAARQRAAHKVQQMKSRMTAKMADRLAERRRHLLELISHEVELRRRFKYTFDKANSHSRGDGDRIELLVDNSVDAYEERLVCNKLQQIVRRFVKP